MQTSLSNTSRRWAIGLLTLAATLFTTTSCSSSDDNDEPTPVDVATTYDGELTTSIPAMPNFAPITSPNSATITWSDASKTSATVHLGEFSISTGMPGRDYVIGAMDIKDIKCSKDSDGTIVMVNDAFECQAGEFATTGTFEGILSNGVFTFTIVYKPGSMPFDVQSVFIGK